MSMSMSTLSTEYVRVRVSATKNGIAYVPTSDTVAMAFVTPGSTPASGDWKTASWETAGSVYYAICLVGPGGNALAAGTYKVWVKVTDSPEVPARPTADTLTVY